MSPDKKKGISCTCPRLTNLLKSVSVGKYNHGGLFLTESDSKEGSLMYSSVGGGLLSIFFSIVFFIYVVVVFHEIFNSQKYNVATKIDDLLEYQDFRSGPGLLGEFDRNFISNI